MPNQHSPENQQFREDIIAIVKANPGIRPGDIAKEIYPGEPKDEHDRMNRSQRTYYWLKQLTKAKVLTQKGNARSSTYRVNSERPEPQVHDIPKRQYRNRRRSAAAPEAAAASTNGRHSDAGNLELIGYIVRDIRQKFSELEALLH